MGRTAGAVLMGLALTGCPADDTGETMGGSAGSSGQPTTSANTSSTTDDSGSTSFDPSTGPVGEAYGTPDIGSTGVISESGTTDTDTDTTGGTTDTDGTSSGTDSGTDSGSTSLGPDYGVPTTSGK